MTQKGFTLIETIIYIALFTILIGAVFYTAFSLIENGESMNSKTIANSELDFVLRKIDGVMNGADVIIIPNNTTKFSPTLSVKKYDGTIVQILRNGTTTEIKFGSESPIPLTTVNVEVSSLGFQYLSGNPAGIIASTTINGISATTTKYIRHD